MLRSHRRLAALALLLTPAWSHAQESKAVFDAPLAVLPGDNRVEHLIDFDGDGWTDLLSWWYTSVNLSTIQVRGWRNEAGTGFSQAWEVSLPGATNIGDTGTLAVGDINGDGELDFAVEYRSQLQLYTRQGLAQPVLVQSMTLPTWVDHVALTDFSGDGLADLLLRQGDQKLLVHRNLGPSAGWAQALQSTTTLAPTLSALRTGELTGDNVVDVLFVLPQHIQILPLDSAGNLGSPILIPTASTWQAPRPAIGDLDGDGDQDVVVWDGDVPNGFYEILRRGGPALLTLEAVRSGGPATELADIDLDGDLDGICCGGSGGVLTWLNATASTFNICHNLGDGAFTPSFQMRGIGSTHIAGASDIDHDGDVDLIAGRAIYYARGSLNSSPGQVLPGPPAGERSLVDYDGDGDGDFQLNARPVFNAGSQQWSHVREVRRSNGQRLFSEVAPTMPTLPAESFYHGAGYHGDFDGDGDVDWIIGRRDATGFERMELLVNRGEGSFEAGGPAAADGVDFRLDATFNHDPRAYFTGDLDGDGDLDLVTRSIDWTHLNWQSRVWLNGGSGFFTPGQVIPGHCVMKLARLNADSHLDVLITPNGFSDRRLQMWRGAGDGTFVFSSHLPAASFSCSGPASSIAVLDLDADGDLDVAAVNEGAPSPAPLLLWRNNGQGGFTQTSLSAPVLVNPNGVSLHRVSVVAGDINGDGWEDLAVGPALEGFGAAWIVLRSPGGVGFEPPVLQGVLPLLLADLDSDGDSDAISLGSNSLDNLRVMSVAIDGPETGARRQYGEGLAAPSGCTPILGAVGPFRVGEVLQLRMRGGAGGAAGYIALSMLEAATPDTPCPGMTRYVGLPLRKLPIKLDGPLGVPCVGEKTRQFTIPPSYAGRTFFHQLVLNDASAPFGVVCSNGLEISYD